MLLVAGTEQVSVNIRLRCQEAISRPRLAAGWRNSKGIIVTAGTEILSEGPWQPGQEYDVSFSFTPRLVVGGYLLRFTVAEYEDGEKELVLEKEGLAELQILDGYRAGLVDLDVKIAAQLTPDTERA